MDLSERGLTAGKVNKIYTLLFKQIGFAITYFLAGMFYNTFNLLYILFVVSMMESFIAFSSLHS